MLSYLLQWVLTFTEVLTLGKGGVMKEENKYSSLYFGDCRVLSFIYSIFTGKILLDCLTCLKRSKVPSFKGMRRYFMLHDPFKPKASLQGR